MQELVTVISFVKQYGPLQTLHKVLNGKRSYSRLCSYPTSRLEVAERSKIIGFDLYSWMSFVLEVFDITLELISVEQWVLCSDEVLHAW